MKQRVLSEHRRKEGEQAKLQALANSSCLGFPYVIVYRRTSEIVEIIRIFHAAQDRRSH